MPTAAIQTYGAGRVDPLKNPDGAHVEVLNLAASKTYPAGTLIGEQIGVRDVQTLSITGSPAGGSFTMTFGGQTTAAIPYNATAAQVEDALELLSTIGVGGVVASGGPLPGTAVVITFQTPGAKAVLTTTDSLTGGTSPATAVAHTTSGTAGTPGTFAPYDGDNTDGSQNPTHILQYACVTDASGNVTFGAGPAGTSEFGQTSKGAPAYRSGLFSCADLVGLDANAVAKMGRLVKGNLQSGEFMVYGN